MSLIMVFTGSTWFQCQGGQVRYGYPDRYIHFSPPDASLAHLDVQPDPELPLWVRTYTVNEAPPLFNLFIHHPGIRGLDLPYAWAHCAWADLHKRMQEGQEICIPTHRTDLIELFARYCLAEKVPFTLIRIDKHGSDFKTVRYSAGELLYALDNNWQVFNDAPEDGDGD